MTVLLTVLVLGIIILVHEIGHFVMARRAGVLCHEFSIGFGPKIYSWQGEETTYSVRAIPLGGYVLMAGDAGNALEGEAPETREIGRRMGDKSIWSRVKIMAAGSMTNIVLAFVIFFVVYAVVGIPLPTLTVEEVQGGYPADLAGMEVGDRIVSVDGREMNQWMEVVETVRRNPDQPLEFTVERDGQPVQLTLVPKATPEGDSTIGFAGIASTSETYRLPPHTAVLEALAWTFMVIVLLGRTIIEMLFGFTGADQLMGVVGIGTEVGRATQMGLASLLSLVGSISASVGFINLLPLPVLDGGRLVLLGYEAATGRTLDPEKEGLINMIGVALLILLAIYVTVQDILRITG